MRSLPALAFLVATLLAPVAHAQADGLLQIGDEIERFLLRQQALGRLSGIDLSNRPLSAYESQRALAVVEGADGLSAADRLLLDRFQLKSEGPGVGSPRRLVGSAYANGRDLVALSGDGYAVQLNPLAVLSAGRAFQSSDAGSPDPVWTYQNTRGARLSGHIGDPDGTFFFFESRVEENQRDVPTAGVPTYGERIGVRYLDDGLYDYWVATGVLGVRTRYVEARFGRDRYAWGPTTTGPLLSGYAPTYDHLQLRTTLGPFTYTNLFASFNDVTGGRNDISGQIASKFGSFHRLAIRLPGHVQLGFYEAAILAPTREDQDLGFYFAYFNPIIFYRALDFEKGSPANALLGADVAWTLPQDWLGRVGTTLYVDFMLDEFRASEFFSGSGWQNNKWGLVMGARVAGLLPGLTAEVEYARMRPFLYSSEIPSRSLVHQDGVLGHPIGPNAQDVSLRLDYRPLPRLAMGLSGAYTLRGRNRGGAAGNFGADPLVGYETNVAREYGNTVGQGIGQTRALVEGRLGYELLPGLFAEGGLRYYDQTDDESAALSRGFADLFVTLRWGLVPPSFRY